MNRQFSRRLFPLLLMLLVLVSCGRDVQPTPIVIVVTSSPSQLEPTATLVPSPLPPSEPTTELMQPAGPAAGEVEILEATFAHALSEDMQPVDPGAEFRPDETVYLSLKLKGRPGKGVVTAQFYWRDTSIAAAGVDLADVNSGVLFSIGEDTYAGYTLTHEQPFPLSDKYRAEVSYDGQPMGTYPFRVVPPPEAIPSQVREVTLATGVDESYNPVEPTTRFASDQTVYLVGRGDLGLTTWLQADWFVSGELDGAGTRSLSLEENSPEVGFSFSFLPEGGWPPGNHVVVLTMNDQEVGRYTFTIASSDSSGALDEAAFWQVFPLPEDAELVAVEEGFDYGFATAMTEPELFDAYANWLREQGWQQQAPTEAMVTLPHQVWRKNEAEFLIEIQGLDEQGRSLVWLQWTGSDG